MGSGGYLATMRRLGTILCLLSSIVATSTMKACTTAPPPAETTAAESVSIDDLLAGEAFGAAASVPIPADEILAMDDDMRAFVAEYVDLRSSPYVRLQQLLRAIINDGSFGLVYEEITRTASGTFKARNGNCLAFTNMFIAMAREANLEVSYQEVDIPPDWSMRGDAYILSRHVNVHVNLRSSGEHVVDFNIDDFKATYDRREISDERAFAHFYSNKAVEQLQAGDLDAAFTLLGTAMEHDLRVSGRVDQSRGTLQPGRHARIRGGRLSRGAAYPARTKCWR